MKYMLTIVLGSSIFSTDLTAQEAPVVRSVEVVDFGTYRMEAKEKPIPMPSASSGAVQLVPSAVLIAQGNRIPATLKTTFGFHFILKGEPIGAEANVDTVVKHPAFKKPDGTMTSTTENLSCHYKIGEVVGFLYEFTNAWEAVPGKWTIEIWQGGKKLAGKEFEVQPERK